MRVYHFVNERYGLEDLARQRLKIATINDLNDPFELLGPGSSDRAVRRRFEYVKQGLAQHRGLLCFSKNWKNPVQWSHYANGHRGLCLGFDVPQRYLVEVAYSRHRLEPNVALLDRGDSASAAEMQRILTTKYSHWRYENEMRVFADLASAEREDGLYFQKFGPLISLREVIVGHRSTVSRSQLSDAMGQLREGIAAFKARLAFRSFKVVKQRRADLWE